MSTYYFPTEEAAKQAVISFETEKFEAFKAAMTESSHPVIYKFNKYRVEVDCTLHTSDCYYLNVYVSKYRRIMSRSYVF
jgi:hypothetical protein